MSLTTGLRLLEAARVETTDPDFTRLMTDAMRRAHIDAFPHVPRLGMRGFGQRLLDQAYAEKSKKGK